MAYDFGGWATRNDVRCSDKRVIRKDAFKHNDGEEVPLVWNHLHNDPMNVLGKAKLQNRDEGVYAYCTFNNTPAGQNARELVRHGDVTSLSIYANQLKQIGTDVIHGVIREVSLVLAGANPGAHIDAVLEHGVESEDSGIIFNDVEELYLEHADTEESEEEEPVATGKEETVQDVFDTLTEKQKTVVYAIIGQAVEDAKGNAQHDAFDDDDFIAHADGEETVQDVFNTLSEKQKTVVYAILGQALEDAKGGNNDEGEEPDEEEKLMKHNVFEADEMNDTDVISHSEMTAVINDFQRFGSMKESALQHGIEDITYLFPDDHAVNKAPGFINIDTGWVSKVMNGVHHTPFSRLKSQWADITEDDARALGYLPDRTHRDSKGNLVDANGNPAKKKEEVFGLLKRTTSPATIYKKQKLDRDDIIDITDFDVVAWIKGEMRQKLNEEIARAILIGDGRLASSDDKINENNIRPIWTDDDLFTIKYRMEVEGGATEDVIAKTLIKGSVKARKNYKGSGTPTLFTTEDYLSDMLLMEDLNGRVIYKSEAELATAMRVKEIVTVPYFENKTRTVILEGGGTETRKLAGIIVNLTDYTVGADKGGEINMFDDFDIDYNQQKYLIETRISGSMLVPYGAIALELVETA